MKNDLCRNNYNDIFKGHMAEIDKKFIETITVAPSQQ